MRRLGLLLMVSVVVMLAACGKGNMLSGQYKVGVGDKDNIEYKMNFTDDKHVTVSYGDFDEEGTYELSKEKNSYGFYEVKFDHFDKMPIVSSSRDGYFFDKEKMVMYEAIESTKEEGKLVPYSEESASDGKTLYLVN